MTWVSVSTSLLLKQKSLFPLYPWNEGPYSAIVGLGDEEVNSDCLNGAPNDETDICLPADLFECDGPCELIEKIRLYRTSAEKSSSMQGGGDNVTGTTSQIRKCHALGAHLEREDFDGIQNQERIESGGVDCTEEIDKSDGRFGGSWRSGGGVGGCGDGDGNPCDAASCVCEEEEWSTTDSIDKTGSDHGENE